MFPHIEEIQAAVRDLDGPLTSLHFRPVNDVEVKKTIRTVERTIYERLGRFSPNEMKPKCHRRLARNVVDHSCEVPSR
jgi:hypothetical protein